MAITADVSDQRCGRALLAHIEDSVSNSVDIETEVLVDLSTEAKEISNSTSTPNDIQG